VASCGDESGAEPELEVDVLELEVFKGKGLAVAKGFCDEFIT